MKGKKIKLVPPDKKRCQAVKRVGSWPDAEHFMVIGPAGLERCRNKPVVIAVENRAADDGLIGSMSLCEECKTKFLTVMGKNFATFKTI